MQLGCAARRTNAPRRTFAAAKMRLAHFLYGLPTALPFLSPLRAFAIPSCSPLCVQFEDKWRTQYAHVIQEQLQADAELAQRRAERRAAAEAAAQEKVAAQEAARQTAAAAAAAAQPMLGMQQQLAASGQAGMLPLGLMQQMMAMQQAGAALPMMRPPS